jgi:hypothetical protein
MSKNPEITFQESLKVATFLGGFTIGILTFLITLDMPKDISNVTINGTINGTTNGPISFLGYPMNITEYKEILITLTGIVATSLIISVFIMK